MHCCLSLLFVFGMTSYTTSEDTQSGLQVVRRQANYKQNTLEIQLIKICQDYLAARWDRAQDQRKTFGAFQTSLAKLQPDLNIGLQLVLKFWQHFGQLVNAEYVDLCSEVLDWMLPSRSGPAQQDESQECTMPMTNTGDAHMSQAQYVVDNTLPIVKPRQRVDFHSHRADQLTASSQHGPTLARHNSFLSDRCASLQQDDSLRSQQTQLLGSSGPTHTPAWGNENSCEMLHWSDTDVSLPSWPNCTVDCGLQVCFAFEQLEPISKHYCLCLFSHLLPGPYWAP